MNYKNNINILLYFFSLNFFNSFIIIFKKRFFAILLFFNFFFNIVIFFKKFKFLWFLYFIHFFRISGFYNIFFKNSFFIAEKYLLKYSLFVKFNLDFIFFITLDLQNNLFLNFGYINDIPFFKMFLNRAYILKFIKNILIFRQFKLCTLNIPGFFYESVRHRILFKKEVTNFNDTLPKVLGWDDKSTRSFFVYSKRLTIYRTRRFWRRFNIWSFSFKRRFSYRRVFLNSAINFLQGSRFYLVNMFCFFVQCTNFYNYFELFNVITLSPTRFLARSIYKVKNSGRKFLTYVSLIFYRKRVARYWKLAFFRGNILSNIRYVYPYLLDYWLVKNIIYSNYRHWANLTKYFITKFSFPFKFIDVDSNDYFLANSIKHLNAFPCFMLNREYKLIAIRRFTKKRLEGIFWLIYKYVGKFLENLLLRKIFLVINRNPSRRLSQRDYFFFRFYVKNKNLFFKRIYFSWELIDLLIWLSYSKDPKPFVKWLARNLTRTHFRKHWAFISYLKKSLYGCWPFMQSAGFLRGIRIRFKGKIGNRGSFRKKTLVVYIGDIAKSDVCVRVDTAFKPSFNFTGVIGIFFTISYH